MLYLPLRNLIHQIFRDDELRKAFKVGEMPLETASARPSEEVLDMHLHT